MPTDFIRKKYTFKTSIISAAALTLIVLSGVYLYVRSWTPVRAFTAKKIDGGSKILLEVSTSTKVKGSIFYGTSPMYLNNREVADGIEGERTFTVGRILPDKEHYVKFVAETPEGRQFETDFLKVK
jgi:hypothetical protein